MSVAVVRSRALAGLAAPPVSVEVHLGGGLPAVNLVGLPETEVREARDRVRAALQNANFDFPSRKVTVNLAPADLPKDSSRFDLPIAIGVLCAAGLLPPKALDQVELVMAIEDEFGIEIDDDTAENRLTSPQAVLEYVAGIKNVPIPAATGENGTSA